MRRSLIVLLLVAVSCGYDTPEQAVLKAMVGNTYRGSGQGVDSVRFTNDQTARLFSGFVRSGRLVVVPESFPLTCGDKQESPRRYILDAKVVYIRVDSAVAAISQTCLAGQSFRRISTDYLLRRHGGDWKLDRPVSAGIQIPG